MEKLFIVLRSDLEPGAQLAQTGHAVSEFSAQHPELFQRWRDGAKNIVVLAVPDEPELTSLLQRARMAHVSTAGFYEPDLGNSLTAIALAAGAQRLVSSLPLAGRPARAA